MIVKWPDNMPEEAKLVAEFAMWSLSRGLPKKREKRRIYSHEEILRGDWKAERDAPVQEKKP